MLWMSLKDKSSCSQEVKKNSSSQWKLSRNSSCFLFFSSNPSHYSVCMLMSLARSRLPLFAFVLMRSCVDTGFCWYHLLHQCLLSESFGRFGFPVNPALLSISNMLAPPLFRKFPGHLTENTLVWPAAKPAFQVNNFGLVCTAALISFGTQGRSWLQL